MSNTHWTEQAKQQSLILGDDTAYIKNIIIKIIYSISAPKSHTLDLYIAAHKDRQHEFYSHRTKMLIKISSLPLWLIVVTTKQQKDFRKLWGIFTGSSSSGMSCRCPFFQPQTYPERGLCQHFKNISISFLRKTLQEDFKKKMSYRAALCPYLKINADESCVRNNTQKQTYLSKIFFYSFVFSLSHVPLRLQKSTVH